MANPLLVFRIGYMPSYDGAGPITGGGAHIREHGEGGEMWNFRVEGGRCYGYVMTRHFVGVDLSRVEPEGNWDENDESSGIDVVFIATKPLVGQVVVGWYKGATVFHKSYRKRPGSQKKGDWEKLDYLCQVDAERAVLLPEDERTFDVPYAPKDGKGYPGQSNVWYPEGSDPSVAQFIVRLRNYLESRSPEKKDAKNPKPDVRGTPDKDLITAIEQAAIMATKNHFEAKGYIVTSVEKDNRGWDLELRAKDHLLLVEVKGHIGNVIQFELTPNEYEKLRENSKDYRVCVVRNAMTSAEVEVYAPHKEEDGWSLRKVNGNGVVRLSERTAARAYESE